jgi:hypothetical protein
MDAAGEDKEDVGANEEPGELVDGTAAHTSTSKIARTMR